MEGAATSGPVSGTGEFHVSSFFARPRRSDISLFLPSFCDFSRDGRRDGWGGGRSCAALRRRRPGATEGGGGRRLPGCLLEEEGGLVLAEGGGVVIV